MRESNQAVATNVQMAQGMVKGYREIMEQSERIRQMIEANAAAMEEVTRSHKEIQDGVAGDLTRLTDSPDDKGYPIWSPDGTCLAYQVYGDEGVELNVVSAQGGGSRVLADNLVWGTGLSWTP